MMSIQIAIKWYILQKLWWKIIWKTKERRICDIDLLYNVLISLEYNLFLIFIQLNQCETHLERNIKLKSNNF